MFCLKLCKADPNSETKHTFCALRSEQITSRQMNISCRLMVLFVCCVVRRILRRIMREKVTKVFDNLCALCSFPCSRSTQNKHNSWKYFRHGLTDCMHTTGRRCVYMCLVVVSASVVKNKRFVMEHIN